MAISVTKIDRITALIKKRINTRIDTIMRDNAEDVTKIRESIREETELELGVHAMFTEKRELELQAESLRKQAGTIDNSVGDIARKIFVQILMYTRLVLSLSI